MIVVDPDPQALGVRDPLFIPRRLTVERRADDSILLHNPTPLTGVFDDAVAAVDAYDRRRDARHSLKDRQKSPEIFGTAEFYGWSEDKARQAMSPEGAGFAAWLASRGFDLTK